MLVQSYLPQVLAIARRAFAGGHADLRPGFFETEDAQRLTLERLRAQSVPIILLDTEDSLRSFHRSFPIVTAYIDQEYRQAATHMFDDRFGISLYVRKDRMPTGTWEPLGWPCYGTGTNVAHSQMMLSEAKQLDGRTRLRLVDRVFGRLRAAVRAWRRPLDSELRVLQEEVRELRREMQSRLLQYNHQLGRMARVSGADEREPSGGCPGARFPWTRASTSRRCGKRSVTRSRFRIPKAASG